LAISLPKKGEKKNIYIYIYGSGQPYLCAHVKEMMGATGSEIQKRK
jgi:hypothetical protein